MPSRADLQAQVTRDFGYADTPATAVSTRIQGYLNDRHRRILLRPGMEQLRFKTQTLTLTANTSTYTLQMPIQRILKITDTTNLAVLEMKTRDWHRRVNAAPVTGIQEFYMVMGWTPALQEPGGTGLWVVSSSASDTTQTVHVETIDTNGSATSSVPTNINGLTRVAIGAAVNHQRLTRFSASAACVGVLSLYDAATNGNQIAVIPLGKTNAEQLQIVLWPTPVSADVLSIDYVHHIRDFVVSYDEPQLPYDFHYLVAVGAKIDEARHKGDDRWSQWQKEWDEGLRLLEDFLGNHPDTLIVPGSLDAAGRSNLGSGYPDGIW